MKASKAPGVSSALHCPKLCPLTAFQVISTPKWRDIYPRWYKSSLHRHSTDSSTLPAKCMNNLYNNNLHLQFSDQPLHRAEGAPRHSHTRAEEQPVLPGFLAQTEIKLRATSTSVTKLIIKCSLEKVFVFNFIQICKFKRSFNRWCSFTIFFSSLNNRFRRYKISRIFSEMLVMLSQKKVLYFYCHGDTALTRGTTYAICKNQEFLFFHWCLLAHWLAHEQTRQEQCVVQCNFHLPKWLSLTFHATHNLFHDVHKGFHEQHPSLRHCS